MTRVRQLCVLEGVGHFPHAEAPDQFVDVLTDFLANTPLTAKTCRRRAPRTEASAKPRSPAPRSPFASSAGSAFRSTARSSPRHSSQPGCPCFCHRRASSDSRSSTGRYAAARALKPGGHFYFDANNLLAFQEVWPLTWRHELPGVVIVSHGRYDAERERAYNLAEFFIRHGKLWERHLERIEQQQAANQGIAGPDDQLEDLRRLQRADHPRQHAKHATFRAARDQSGRRCVVERRRQENRYLPLGN